MKTIEEQLTECRPNWVKLITALIPEIQDEYRASDDPGDNTPAMCLTIGFTPETEDRDYSWHYQTGDNSFTGGAYGHAFWAVVTIFRDSVPSEIADEIADELAEIIAC